MGASLKNEFPWWWFLEYKEFLGFIGTRLLGAKYKLG